MESPKNHRTARINEWKNNPKDTFPLRNVCNSSHSAFSRYASLEKSSADGNWKQTRIENRRKRNLNKQFFSSFSPPQYFLPAMKENYETDDAEIKKSTSLLSNEETCMHKTSFYY